jgi:hypothetical protein
MNKIRETRIVIARLDDKKYPMKNAKQKTVSQHPSLPVSQKITCLPCPHLFLIIPNENTLQLVIIIADIRNRLLHTLSFSHLLDNLTSLGCSIDGRSTGQHLPMIENRLRESLSTSIRTEIGGETERLVDGEVSLDVEQGSTGTLLLGKDVTSSAGKDTIDTTHG